MDNHIHLNQSYLQKQVSLVIINHIYINMLMGRAE